MVFTEEDLKSNIHKRRYKIQYIGIYAIVSTFELVHWFD